MVLEEEKKPIVPEKDLESNSFVTAFFTSPNSYPLFFFFKYPSLLPIPLFPFSPGTDFKIYMNTKVKDAGLEHTHHCPQLTYFQLP